MEEGSAVIESPESVEEEEKKAGDEDLVGFSWGEYSGYLPEDTERKDFLIGLLEHKQYGWKKRARLLMRIQETDTLLQKLIVEFHESAVTDRFTKPKPVRSVGAREGLQIWLNSRSEDTLQQLCEDYSVSYDSFKADKPMLIEALLDEMNESVEV